MSPTRRQYQIFVDRPPQAVFDFFVNLRSYGRTLPNDTQQITNEVEMVLREGATLHLKWKQGLAWKTVDLEIVEWNPPHGFTERQVNGPFLSFVHRHKFTEFQTGTLMTDQIEYTLSGGPIAVLQEKLLFGTHLDTLFATRQKEAKRVLETITRIKGRGV